MLIPKTMRLNINKAVFLLSQVYRWTGENSYFVKGDIDSLHMGGGGCVHLSVCHLAAHLFTS